MRYSLNSGTGNEALIFFLQAHIEWPRVFQVLCISTYCMLHWLKYPTALHLIKMHDTSTKCSMQILHQHLTYFDRTYEINSAFS